MASTCHAFLTFLFYQAVQQLSGRLFSSALLVTSRIFSRRSAAALPVLDVSARLMPPREFVVTLVPHPGQGALACPLSGLDASSPVLHCPSVPLPEGAQVVFHPRSWTRPRRAPFQNLHPSGLSTRACIRRKLELADKVFDCYKLDVDLGPPEQASNLLPMLPSPVAVAASSFVRPFAMAVLT